MPLTLLCEELEAGMRLFEPVVWHDMVMLPSGRVLTPDDIGQLRQRFPNLSIRVGDPVLDSALDFPDDSHERQAALMIKTKIMDVMTANVDERIGRQMSVQKVNFVLIHAAVKEILSFLLSNPVTAVLLARSLDSDQYIAEHIGNVFYLSMVLGCAARTYVSNERQRLSKADLRPSVTMDLAPLGLGVMFMDAAMPPVANLLKPDHKLSEEEWRQIREHPIAGADGMPDTFSAAAKAVIRCHHENNAGLGYPAGLPGDRIHVLARVVRIADAYETGTARHAFGQARSPVRVLYDMTCGPQKKLYDPELLKVFARLVHPFPIGAKVRLQGGQHAIIMRYNQNNPFQPFGVIAYDDQNNRVPVEQLSATVQLGSQTGLRIESYQGEDLSYLYKAPPVRDPASPQRRPQTLFEAGYP